LTGFIPFLMANGFGTLYPRLKEFLTALRKDESTSTLPVGAAGFCWGGKLAIMAAGDEEKVVDGKRLIDAGFVGHPSRLELPAEIEKMTVPMSFALGELDKGLDAKQTAQIKSIVEAKPDDQKGEVVTYEGVGHGFCIRADVAILDVAKQATAAEDQCIQWFNKHLGLTSS
jgi:dienelactone hydrolase